MRLRLALSYLCLILGVATTTPKAIAETFDKIHSIVSPLQLFEQTLMNKTSLSQSALLVNENEFSPPEVWYSDLMLEGIGRVKIEAENVSPISAKNLWYLIQIMNSKSLCSWDSPALINGWNCLIQTVNSVIALEYTSNANPTPIIRVSVIKIPLLYQTQNLNPFYFGNLTGPDTFSTVVTVISADNSNQQNYVSIKSFDSNLLSPKHLSIEFELNESRVSKDRFLKFCGTFIGESWFGCTLKPLIQFQSDK